AVLIAPLVVSSSSALRGAAKSMFSAAGASPCQIASPAFCDTFDQPAPTGNRPGDLNGTVWGVSRIKGGGFNSGQGQFDNWVTPATMTGTCPTQTVTADNDIKI